jgi:hypothetical protein
MKFKGDYYFIQLEGMNRLLIEMFFVIVFLNVNNPAH